MTGDKPPPADRILLPHEVAKIFRVDPKTVTRWAASGKIPTIQLPGGHYRYLLSDIEAILKTRRMERPSSGSPPTPEQPSPTDPPS
jgi:excisionase family DNA binding protein